MTVAAAEESEAARLVRLAAGGVHAALGPGWSEAVYQAALEVELRLRGVPFSSQEVMPVRYRGVAVGAVRADIVVLDPATHAPTAVWELKATTHRPNASELSQARRYAQLLGMPNANAFVINFGQPQLEVGFGAAVAGA